MMDLNETLKIYGFTERKLEILEANAYWAKPYDWAKKGLKKPYWLAAKDFIAQITLLPKLSDKQEAWVKQIQENLVECSYSCMVHRGKVEWHHPIRERSDIGLYLCECHHSILLGRKRKYTFELGLGKTLEQMRIEIKQLEQEAIIRMLNKLINKR